MGIGMVGLFCVCARRRQEQSFDKQSVLGWLGLGLPSDALAELQKIRPALQRHPAILEAWWLVYAELKLWKDGLKIALVEKVEDPESPSGWIHQAYALRRVEGGGLPQAFDVLMEAAELFPTESIIPYNLACYLCRMGRMAECREWR